MVDPAKKRATYEDVLAAPHYMIAEIIDGELRLQPRLAKPHAAAASALGEELGPPFKRGRGGPGGWIILDDPELHVGPDVLVPDLAGWRRERAGRTRVARAATPADSRSVASAPARSSSAGTLFAGAASQR